MENWKWNVENCEYYNPKTKKCRIFREPECGVKVTSFKCEDDHDCYYKRLGKNIEEIIDLRKYIEKMDKPEIKTIDAEVAMENERLKEQCDTLNRIAYENIEKYAKIKFVLQEIREELEEDITCESRECGCDDYGECLNCLKETILTKINSVIGAENGNC